jgi:hypothetical protein
MRRGPWCLSAVFLGTALVSPLLHTGCAERHYYRTYDPDHHDYHRWDERETTYYHQWVVENHRDDRDFRRLNSDQQKEYWNWRHSHDHDQDKGHDHDRDKH